METLKNTVQSKTAVPTAQVYVSILQSNWMFFSWRELCSVTLQCYAAMLQHWLKVCSQQLATFHSNLLEQFAKVRCSFDKFRVSFCSYNTIYRIDVFLLPFWSILENIGLVHLFFFLQNKATNSFWSTAPYSIYQTI